MKLGHKKEETTKKEAATLAEGEKSFFQSFLHELRRRKIFETVAAFIGGGWLIIEFVHWILVDHYHFPEKSIDITFISLLGALISTIIWRLFREGKKKERKFKIEYVFIFLVILATAVLDISLITTAETHKEEESSGLKWENSIAVLPFEDLSPGKDQEYLSDGMTDAIISKLSMLGELKVVSRTSVMRYKEKVKDITEIGEELNVRTILEGTVQKVDKRIRIRSQLINAEDGFHLWSETYDQDIENIFALQDKISHSIVDSLKIKIAKETSIFLDKHSTENLDAYTLYLKGRAHWNKRTVEDLREGMKYFEKALEEDPGYALAYSGIADSYIGLANFNVLRPHEAYPKAREWARKALQSDKTIAEAHASIAIIKLFYDWDWGGAEQKFKRSLELNPNYVTSLQTYAFLLAVTNRHDEARIEIFRARELDPMSLPVHTASGIILYLDRQNQAAQSLFLEITQMVPEFPMAYFYQGWTHIQEANFQKALELFRKAHSLSKGDPRIKSWLGYTHALMGHKKESLRILNELKTLQAKQYIDPSFIALIYLGLDDKDQTFEWLNKGYRERSFWLVWLDVDPVFDSIRQDKRFKALLQNMKFSAISETSPQNQTR